MRERLERDGEGERGREREREGERGLGGRPPEEVEKETKKIKKEKEVGEEGRVAGWRGEGEKEKWRKGGREGGRKVILRHCVGKAGKARRCSIQRHGVHHSTGRALARP